MNIKDQKLTTNLRSGHIKKEPLYFFTFRDVCLYLAALYRVQIRGPLADC